MTHTHHEPGPATPGCRDCHMPARNYMVVDPRRDHSFRVPRPDLAEELGVTDACASCHTDQSASWSADAVRQWLGRDAQGLQDFAQVFTAGRLGKINAADALRALVADADQPAIVRATALHLLASYPGPQSFQSAQVALDDADPAVRLAALGPIGAAPVTEQLSVLKALWRDPVRAVRIEAARMLAGADISQLHATERQHFATALADYVEAQHASLDRPSARLNLGNLYAQLGDVRLAEEQYRAALALDPDFEPAYVNFANLLFRYGDEAGAGDLLQQALQVLPASAALHHALGLHLIRAGQAEAALLSLAKAVELAPADQRFAYVYAVALNSAGRDAEARVLLQQAHDLREADQEILHALLGIEMQLGNNAAVLEYGERLLQLRPWDKQLEDLLEKFQTN